MTDLRLPPPAPARPTPRVRLTEELRTTNEPEWHDEVDAPAKPADGTDHTTAELVGAIDELQQENAELQAYLDRVLETLATVARENDLKVVIDDPLAPTQYQRAATPGLERRTPAATPVKSAEVGAAADAPTAETTSPAATPMRWAANGPDGGPDPVPPLRLRRRASDRLETRIEAAQQTLGELIYLLDRELRARDDFDDAR